MTDTDTGAQVVVDQPQPALSVAQSPSFCRLCNVELCGQQTWRAHVKSDGHIYKLRLKVAEPGSITSPPSPPPPSGTAADQSKDTAPPHAQNSREPDASGSRERSFDSDTDEMEPSAPEFVPGQCLFCAQESDDAGALDDNLTHMAEAHGFSVPFQDCLAADVDVETVVRYLHLVIHGYRECICCGTRRSTVEGVQQHMVAKGHCRFDVSPDTEDFYEMPQSESSRRVMEQTQRDDSSVPVRLPSGKLISHRRDLDPQEPRVARRAAPERNLLDSYATKSNTSRAAADTSSSPPPSSTPGLEVAQRRRGGGGGNGSGEIVRSSEALLAAQLSRLRIAGDRAQQKEEQRKRGRLESANNIILSKHFRLDAGDSRIGRKFC